MTLRERITKWPLALLVSNEIKRFRANRCLNKVDDITFIKKTYLHTTRHKLDLENPRRLTEKLQWLKLFYRDEQMPICSDKYMLRQYLAERGYSNLLNDLIAVYDSLDDLDIDALPGQFVLKMTHGSGWNIFCSDKHKINWPIWKRIIQSWMKQNLYIYGREWNYKDLRPRIVIERYLEDVRSPLSDYKLFCFNGFPKIVQVDIGLISDHKVNFYDNTFSLLPYRCTYPNYEGEIRKPEVFDKMKVIAADLSKGFPHVRVDFMTIGEKLFISELTFFDGSGFYNFHPDEWDVILGNYLVLPKPNYKP
jgi:hypothetical protein